jgi:hypothetical protein
VRAAVLAVVLVASGCASGFRVAVGPYVKLGEPVGAIARVSGSFGFTLDGDRDAARALLMRADVGGGIDATGKAIGPDAAFGVETIHADDDSRLLRRFGLAVGNDGADVTVLGTAALVALVRHDVSTESTLAGFGLELTGGPVIDADAGATVLFLPAITYERYRDYRCGVSCL